MGEHYTEFSLGEKHYGVSAIEEDVNGLTTIRIDFHYKITGGIQHQATNFGADSLKVLSIVANGIKAKFSDVDIIYFLAKHTDSDKEFDSRVKLYSRIVDKLKVENNLIPVKQDLGKAYLFGLCKNTDSRDVLLSFI